MAASPLNHGLGYRRRRPAERDPDERILEPQRPGQADHDGLLDAGPWPDRWPAGRDYPAGFGCQSGPDLAADAGLWRYSRAGDLLPTPQDRGNTAFRADDER